MSARTTVKRYPSSVICSRREGRTCERPYHHPSDGVGFVIVECAAEVLVEVLDRRTGLDRELPVGVRADQTLVAGIVLVVDLAHDLLQHVLDGHETGHAPVLVHDDRHVVAPGLELAQQDVQPLALRNEDRGTHRVRQVEALASVAGKVGEQVLGEQDAHHLVAVVADHREPRVPRFDDRTHELLRQLVVLDHHHLRARHHDVADLHVPDRECTLDHRQRVGTHHVAALRVAQGAHERRPIPRLVPLARQDPGHAPEPRPCPRFAVRRFVHGPSPAAYGSG